MTEDESRISDSAETLEAAFAAVKNQAAEKWGHGNFDVTVSRNPSKNLTTGETLLYTAVAKRFEDDEPTVSLPGNYIPGI